MFKILVIKEQTHDKKGITFLQYSESSFDKVRQKELQSELSEGGVSGQESEPPTPILTHAHGPPPSFPSLSSTESENRQPSGQILPSPATPTSPDTPMPLSLYKLQKESIDSARFYLGSDQQLEDVDQATPLVIENDRESEEVSSFKNFV